MRKVKVATVSVAAHAQDGARDFVEPTLALFREAGEAGADIVVGLSLIHI